MSVLLFFITKKNKTYSWSWRPGSWRQGRKRSNRRQWREQRDGGQERWTCANQTFREGNEEKKLQAKNYQGAQNRSPDRSSLVIYVTPLFLKPPTLWALHYSAHLMATMTDLFRRYFSVDPLYSSPVKLFVSAVLSLPLFDNRPGSFMRLSHTE